MAFLDFDLVHDLWFFHANCFEGQKTLTTGGRSIALVSQHLRRWPVRVLLSLRACFMSPSRTAAVLCVSYETLRV